MKKRIKFLEDVITTVEKGGDIYAVEYAGDSSEEDSEKLRIASEVTNLILEGRFSEIPAYGNDLVKKLTPDLLESIWNRVLLANGKFLSVGDRTVNENIVTIKLHFEKRTIDFKINISVGVVTGLFFQYINV